MRLAPLLWLDIEATGLDIYDDVVLEIACVLTTPDLDRLGEFHSLVADPGWQGQLAMNSTVVAMHTANGLIAALLEAPAGSAPPLRVAEFDLCAWLTSIVGPSTKVRLAGSGVRHFDHPLINEQMPLLAERLHRADLDISDLRRGFRYLGAAPAIERDDVPHRALADIEVFLDEFATYKTHLSAQIG